MDIRDSINSPGKGHGTGDDRFGHDEGAGTAWVLDGATDICPGRLFRDEESDAAWIATALSGALLRQPPGPADTHAEAPLRAYFARLLSDVRALAARQALMDLSRAPPECSPIASGIWVHVTPTHTHADLVWAGDCMALIAPPNSPVTVIGEDQKADLETERSRRFAHVSREKQLAELRRIRAIQNTSAEHLIFGLHPDAASRLRITRVPLRQGTDIVLMTDGLWRLIQPYGLMTPDALMALIREEGLSGALSVLRTHEADPTRDRTTRFKASDDSCAVWLSV